MLKAKFSGWIDEDEIETDVDGNDINSQRPMWRIEYPDYDAAEAAMSSDDVHEIAMMANGEVGHSGNKVVIKGRDVYNTPFNVRPDDLEDLIAH